MLDGAPAEMVGSSVKPRDKVAFTIEDDRVGLTPEPFTLESAYRSVEPNGRPGRLKDFSQAAKDSKAEQALRESSSDL